MPGQSDLDVVWLNGHWQRWMTWDDPLTPPVPEAALAARADILVSTDELSIANDLRGGRPHELNTGVLRFRGSKGALAMLGAWRGAMTRMRGRKDLTENVNDQALFNQARPPRDSPGPAPLFPPCEPRTHRALCAPRCAFAARLGPPSDRARRRRHQPLPREFATVPARARP